MKLLILLLTISLYSSDMSYVARCKQADIACHSFLNQADINKLTILSKLKSNKSWYRIVNNKNTEILPKTYLNNENIVIFILCHSADNAYRYDNTLGNVIRNSK